MIKSISADFHGWRGFGRAAQGDFFIVSVRLGFASLHICRICLVERLQQLKQIVDEIEIASRDYPERQARHWDGR